MSRVIWKFELLNADTQVITMPQGSRVVRVAWQSSAYGVGPALWAEVDPHAVQTTRTFGIVATGRSYIEGVYVGTFETMTGEVMHVIEP